MTHDINTDDGLGQALAEIASWSTRHDELDASPVPVTELDLKPEPKRDTHRLLHVAAVVLLVAAIGGLAVAALRSAASTDPAGPAPVGGVESGDRTEWEREVEEAVPGLTAAEVRSRCVDANGFWDGPEPMQELRLQELETRLDELMALLAMDQDRRTDLQARLAAGEDVEDRIEELTALIADRTSMIRVTETELHSLEEQLTPPPDQQATVDELARSGTLSLLYVEREADRSVVMISAPLANAVCLLERTPSDEWTADASMTVFAGSATNIAGITLGTASSIDPDVTLVALSGRAGSNVSSLTVLADGGNTPVAMVDGWFGVVTDVVMTTGGAADGPDLDDVAPDGQFGVQVEVRYTDGQTEVLTW